jgi:site-specific DNA-methyltransferase (adenine-specific)
MIRELEHVIRANDAEIGIFVTAVEPTKPMKTTAAKAGFYHSERFNKDYPRIQILTIKDLMEGTARAEFPDLSQGGLNFKAAERNTEAQVELFGADIIDFDDETGEELSV